MNTRISRRRVIGSIGVGVAALAAPPWVRAQRSSIKVGWAISKTGPFAGGAAVTQWPNYLLWIKDVNDAGGLLVDGRRLKLEYIEYDDRSQSEEAVRAVERLINQDKVDILLPPWGTGQNLAVAPIFARGGYPMLAGSMASDRTPEIVKRWPNVFSLLNTSTTYAEAIVAVLSQARAAGLINDRVALAHATEQFGIELANAARRALKAANFNIVYDGGYPMATQDLTPVISEAQRANPDTFIAFSYPPDTMALAETARVRGFNPKVFYTAVGTFFPMYRDRFKENATGVMGIGGWNPDNDAFRAYIKRHVAMHGREPDRWGASLFYAGLQALGQTIEKVGLNNAEIVKYLRANSFDTIVGKLEFDQNNVRKGGWFVGQWQDGDYYGVYPNQPGVRKPIIPKPAWKA
ncbi:MAG: amino acid ABC transporter substrate-binding protein [Sutterellaceae bacterium]|nr:amino acid ABC transporter substrate-binding protein [Burkholderiaceae bacterium]MDW8429800.1 amino acid ABC transporter substrate-binding protein [Sutterellaceae bacterium]